jgi:iron complex outermembrane recepter protein
MFYKIAVMIALGFIIITMQRAQAQTAARFDLPAQSMADSLKAVANQTNTNVLFDLKLVEGLQAPALKAQLTPQAAIGQLLAGAKVSEELLNEHTIVLTAVSTPTSNPQRTTGSSAGSFSFAAASAASTSVGTEHELRVAQVSSGTPATPSPENQGETSASQNEADTKLEEVTVTATRRTESLQKVPISVQALGQDELEAGNIKTISDIAAVTPGLQFNTPGNPQTNTVISIRGLNTGTGASTVGLYLDDTPIQVRLSPVGNIGNPYPALFDLNRVEVERGPQGTLFGAGSEGGTVRFISNQPSLGAFTGFSHAELSTTRDGGSSYEIGAAAGGAIVADTLGFRVSAWTRQDGGYVNLVNPLTGSTTTPDSNRTTRTALKATLALRMTGGVLLTPSVFYQTSYAPAGAELYGNFSNIANGLFNNAPMLAEANTDHFVVPSVKIEAGLPFADLTSVTSYMSRKVDLSSDASALLGAVGAASYGSPLGSAFPTSPSDVAPFLSTQSERAFTQELRLASNSQASLLSWIAGIFYDHRTQDDFSAIYSTQVDPTGAAILDDHQSVTDDQIAIFAQGDLHLTDKLTATLGERVAKVKADFYETGTGVLNAGISPVSSATQRQTPNTPRAALSYQADRNNLFYISASEGFRVGGGNAPLPSFCNLHAPETYGADYVWNYEVGSKNTLFDGRVQSDASVFHIDWSKIQQLLQAQCGLQYTDNVGRAASNGFDLALKVIPLERLRVDLDVGYANAYFTRTVLDNAGSPLIVAGDKIGLTPQVNSPWNVNTSVNYEIPLGNGDRVHLRGEYQFDSRNPGPFLTQIKTSPDYFPLNAANPPTHLFNARAGMRMTNKLDVAFFVSNVFNSHPSLNALQYAATSNLVQYNTFRPRTVGLSLDFSF